MDSVTQLALGAAVAEASIGRKVGNKAILWGAALGTLPDLDVLVSLGDAVSDFTYHRSASHSLFLLALAAPLIGWAISKFHEIDGELRRRWMWTVLLVFVTHVLLDSFTVYGTQIFWPISETPMTWSTIFIIDPLYTLPLLVGIIAALVMTRQTDRGHLINRTGLVLSSLYLAWTLVAKTLVDARIEDSLADQQIEHNDFLTTPTPFNSLLWRAVVRADGAYYEGFYSLFDDGPVRYTKYPSADDLLAALDDVWTVQRLRWFSKGFYGVSQRGTDIVISDLRMGVEPNYVFSFKVAESSNPHPQAVDPVHLDNSWDRNMLPRIWHRIWSEDVALQQ